MNIRKLTLIAVGLLLVSQLAMHNNMDRPSRKMRLWPHWLANTRGGLPVVPNALPVTYRPHIWMGGMVAGQKIRVGPSQFLQCAQHPRRIQLVPERSASCLRHQQHHGRLAAEPA